MNNLPVIVQIQSPNHTSRQAHLSHILRLATDCLNIIIPHPLPVLVRVGAHQPLGVLDHGPTTLLDIGTDLVVGEEAGGTGELAGLALLASGRVEAVVAGAVQGEGLAVQRHTHD